MTAFVRITLLRWLRRPLGAGLLAAPFLFSGLGHVIALVGGHGKDEIGGVVSFNQFFVLVVGSIVVSNQLAAMIQEEMRLGRLPLLRIGGLDGARAVACYAAVGLALCVVFGSIGYTVAIISGLGLGVPAKAWLAPLSRGPALILCAVPAGILSGLVLPRVVALIFLTIGGIAWGAAASGLGPHPPAAAPVALGTIVALAVLPPFWTRLAGR